MSSTHQRPQDLTHPPSAPRARPEDQRHGGPDSLSHRNLYGANQTSWGATVTDEFTLPKDPTPGTCRSFLNDDPPPSPGKNPVTQPNRRRRPDLVALTAFPTPRGLCVAHGGRLC